MSVENLTSISTIKDTDCLNINLNAFDHELHLLLKLSFFVLSNLTALLFTIHKYILHMSNH